MQKQLLLTKLLFGCEIFFVLIIPICLVASILSGAFLVTGLGLFINVVALVIAFIQIITQHENGQIALHQFAAWHHKRGQSIKRLFNTSIHWLAGSGNSRKGLSPLLLILLILLITSSAIGLNLYQQVHNPTRPPINPLPLSNSMPQLTDLSRLSDGQQVGLSDGRNVFDLGSRAGSANQQQYYRTLKQEGADAVKKGNTLLARKDWEEAVSQQYYPDDAETLIYLEDLNVTASSNPYVTYILVTQLSGDETALNRGRDDLQGAYVALKEFNTRNDAHVLARLWIANIGDSDAGTMFVENRIIQLATNKQLEPTFAGTIGWPEHTDTVNDALNALCKYNVPDVTISSSSITGTRSQCDFSVAPSSDAQAATAANFATTQLKAQRVSIIYDPANSYSNNMAGQFGDYFRASATDHRIVDKENYTLGQGSSLAGLVRATIRGNPDLIYFVGYPSDIEEVLKEIQHEGAHINVLGSDILYQAPHYPGSISGNQNNLYFTAFAYPDEWSILGMSPKPAFVDDYGHDFDPEGIHSKGTYGFERADNDTLITYDAMSTVLKASETLLDTGKTNISSAELLMALPGVKFQGISGLIQFDATGNEVAKTVIVVAINAQGENSYTGYLQGNYLCSSCTQF